MGQAQVNPMCNYPIEKCGFMVGLFDPVQIGAVHLSNRVIMSPLTRSRASRDRVPNDLMRSYYCQRASAGLIIAEATAISPQGIGFPNTPGIWCTGQVQGWRHITDAVHAKNGQIFLQLWHVGRVSDPELLNGLMPVGPSAIACDGLLNVPQMPELQRPFVVPRALRTEEIGNLVADFAAAAANARLAGFDGVEVHAADGYLIDQFLHDHSNQRQDGYGGVVENRCRLLFEVVDACVGVWGADRVGVHLSPFGAANAMQDSNPRQLFAHIAQALGRRELAFLFIREAQAQAAFTAELKQLFGGPVIINQNLDLQTAQAALASGRADAVAFGRPFISNPDLVERLRARAPLNEWDETSFYTEGPKGYVDYPFFKACCREPENCSQ